MSAAHVTRRDFVEALGLGSVAALIPRDAHANAIADDALAPNGTRPFRRDDFLFAPGLVYLDTGALGACPRQVVDASMRAWYALERNPKAIGYGAGTVRVAAERLRELAARLLGCTTDEIAITRSTTDGMNAIAQGMRLVAGDHVLMSDQEHEGGFMGWQYLAHRNGVVMDRVAIPLDEHDPASIVARFAAAITPATRVISTCHVFGSTGLRMPIAELSALARARGLLCVVDGAQAVGNTAVDVKALGCHAYATSGHKWLMGPKGTGLLYIAKDASDAIMPMQLEDGRAFYSESSGVGNLPGAIGLGVAIEALTATGITTVERHNVALRDRIYDGLQRLGRGRVLSAAPGPLATAIVTYELPAGFDSTELTVKLRETHRVEVKPVPKRWLNGLRLSPHVFNNGDDVNRLLTALRIELASKA